MNGKKLLAWVIVSMALIACIIIPPIGLIVAILGGIFVTVWALRVLTGEDQ